MIKKLFIPFFLGFLSYGLRAQSIDSLTTPPKDSTIDVVSEGKLETLKDTVFDKKTHLELKEKVPYEEFKKRLKKKTGLNYNLVMSPIFQVGSRGKKWTANIETDLLGELEVFNKPKGHGGITWWFLNIYNISPLYTKEFSQGQKLSHTTNFGDVPYRNFSSFFALWWEQKLIKKKLQYRIGHLNSNMIWANNTYINDDRVGFMSLTLSSPGAAQWINLRGLGGQMIWKEKKYYLGLGFQDLNHNLKYPDFKSFFMGEYVYVAEVGWYPLETLERTKISFTLNIADKHTLSKTGYGIIGNIRHDITKKIGFFARYGQSFEYFSTDYKQSFATGFVFKGITIWDNDRVGVGYMYNVANNVGNGIDEGLEIYYKWLITNRFSLSLDSQIYFQSSLAKNNDLTTILGARCRLVS